MILTSSFYPQHPMPHYAAYTPPRPSPLSPRAAAAAAAPALFTMSSPIREKPPADMMLGGGGGQSHVHHHHHRAYKTNPMLQMQTRDVATKRRRDMFFKRVQTKREDKKWEARGEQIQQLDFVAERRRWEAEKARQAPRENEEDGFIEEEVLLEDADDAAAAAGGLPHQQHAPLFEAGMTEADWVAAQEEYEVQQLVASMEQESHGPSSPSQHYGSDDDDYDAIFMECAMGVGNEPFQHQHQHQQQAQAAFDTDMDMDMDTDMMEG
ncbi:hypothetical protein GMOD_00005367 [Pyrenophora seminiperda CCB06]|uniref:Uncharacterized protein n=1 Tax=Pyrenophora seminiperda CCB06 TaxID=1302712 RepID=A0A3M7LVN6_9PLEO|nr:hypothetical protein GMOD_00005367 [Pyrenophora seminiperda CCB06]